MINQDETMQLASQLSPLPCSCIDHLQFS